MPMSWPGKTRPCGSGCPASAKPACASTRAWISRQCCRGVGQRPVADGGCCACSVSEQVAGTEGVRHFEERCIVRVLGRMPFSLQRRIVSWWTSRRWSISAHVRRDFSLNRTRCSGKSTGKPWGLRCGGCAVEAWNRLSFLRTAIISRQLRCPGRPESMAGRCAERKLPQSARPGAFGEAAVLLAQGPRRPPRVSMCVGFPVPSLRERSPANPHSTTACRCSHSCRRRRPHVVGGCLRRRPAGPRPLRVEWR